MSRWWHGWPSDAMEHHPVPFAEPVPFTETVRLVPMPQAPYDLAERPIVFTHIPKTAGTTVNFGLRKAFPDSSAFHLQRQTDSELQALAADRKIKAYAGHLPYCRSAVAFAGSGRQPLYVTVLRDPIERVLSAYAYAKGTPKERWHDLANRLDINAFILHMQKEQPQFLVGKQCRFLSPDGQADADTAFLSLQENFALVGLQKNINDFFYGLEHLTGQKLPQPKRRNQSTQRVGREALDAATVKVLDATTVEDRKLYLRTQLWLADASRDCHDE